MNVLLYFQDIKKYILGPIIIKTIHSNVTFHIMTFCDVALRGAKLLRHLLPINTTMNDCVLASFCGRIHLISNHYDLPFHVFTAELCRTTEQLVEFPFK